MACRSFFSFSPRHLVIWDVRRGCAAVDESGKKKIWRERKSRTAKESARGRGAEGKTCEAWRHDTSCFYVWGGCCTGHFNRLSPCGPSNKPVCAPGAFLLTAVGWNVFVVKCTSAASLHSRGRIAFGIKPLTLNRSKILIVYFDESSQDWSSSIFLILVETRK